MAVAILVDVERKFRIGNCYNTSRGLCSEAPQKPHELYLKRLLMFAKTFQPTVACQGIVKLRHNDD